MHIIRGYGLLRKTEPLASFSSSTAFGLALFQVQVEYCA